jgi:hypothetical protein
MPEPVSDAPPSVAPARATFEGVGEHEHRQIDRHGWDSDQREVFEERMAQAEELGMMADAAKSGEALRTAEIEAALANHPEIAESPTVRQALHLFGGRVVSVKPRAKKAEDAANAEGSQSPGEGPTAPPPASPTQEPPAAPPAPTPPAPPPWTSAPSKPADVNTDAFDAKVKRRRFDDLFPD